MSDSNMAIPASGLNASNINSSKVDSKPIIKTEAKAEANDLQTEKAIKPTQEEVEIVIKELNEFMETTKRGLSFSVDKQLGIELVSVMDLETEEVIRQIPSEELVVLRKKMDDIAGVLFETKV
ncbi:MAG: flagellar protein FlaG [Psychromonas sp.]|nr:flagellar protein FlaG [Psychromonas sp.]